MANDIKKIGVELENPDFEAMKNLVTSPSDPTKLIQVRMRIKGNFVLIYDVIGMRGKI